MRILLTNDDGIHSAGLLAAKRALEAVGTVAVIAPGANMSAVGRGITIGRSLEVVEVELGDGSTGYATDGTPVDCVRFAALGLVGEPPDLIVSGINYGLNLGDDVTYSGTVAAAFEGILLGIPGIAVSQQSLQGELGFQQHPEYDFTAAASFLSGLVSQVSERGLPSGTVLNVNVPSPPVRGVAVARLGKRIYRDQLELESDREGRRRYRIYGDDPSYHDEPETDFRALAEGRVAVTPIHLDLTSGPALAELGGWALGMPEARRRATSGRRRGRRP
jgi:5'-nucleotidase